MSSISKRASVAVYLLSLTLLLPVAVSAEGTTPRPHGRTAYRTAQDAGWLARIGHALTSLFAANGASLDPFGNPQGTSATNSDRGLVVQPLVDNGPSLDPFGGH